MNVTAEFVSQALELPPSQREELAWLLLESLSGGDDAPVEVSVELDQILRTRIAEREAGTAKTVDLATFAAAVRAAAGRPASP